MPFWREKTVDEIVKGVAGIVNELRDRAKAQYVAAGNHLKEADQHHQHHNAATAEANRADRLADKFADLIA